MLGRLPLADNSWIGLLIQFPAQARLYDKLHGCLGSLVRLSRQLGLGTILSGKWGYELASMPGKAEGRSLGPAQFVVWRPNSGKSVH